MIKFRATPTGLVFFIAECKFIKYDLFSSFTSVTFIVSLTFVNYINTALEDDMSKRLVFALGLMAMALFGLSACTPCDMVAPDLVSPDWREILDPNVAVLNWNYTDSCTPDNFEIYLSKDSSFSVIEHTGTVAGSAITWTAQTLDDAEEYFWEIGRAHV